MSNKTQSIDILISNDKCDRLIFDSFCKDSFNASQLNKSFNLKLNEINDSPSECYGYLSKRYIHARIAQFTNIVEYITTQLNLKNNDHKLYAISCDTDIVFFPYFDTEIHRLLNSNHDTTMYFMAENLTSKIPNIGFIIFKIDKESLSFFEELVSIYKSEDQEAIKNVSYIAVDFLQNKNIKYVILDLKFANNNYQKFKYKHYLINNKLCCFHATNSFNIYEKIDILSKLYTSTRKYIKTFVLPHNYYDWISILSQQNNDIVTYEDLQKKNQESQETTQKEINYDINQATIIMYISYIVQYYDNLPDYVFFFSDAVFETTNLAKYLVPNNILYELCDICNIRGGVMCMAPTSTHHNELKLPNKPYPVSLAYFLDRMFDLKNEDISQIEYGDSDCYIIRKNNILNRPKIFYENLLKFITLEDFHSLIIEKIILYIFDLKIPLKHENGSLIL